MDIMINSNGYGGRHWTLSAYGKQFYLGQDVKFIARVLGLRPRDLLEHAGLPMPCSMTSKANRQKIARSICEILNINRSNIKTISAWDICAE